MIGAKLFCRGEREEGVGLGMPCTAAISPALRPPAVSPAARAVALRHTRDSQVPTHGLRSCSQLPLLAVKFDPSSGLLHASLIRVLIAC